MKKSILPLAFLLAAICSATAQSNVDGTGLRLGFNAGPSFSWLASSDKILEGAGTNLGFRFGFNAEKYFTNNYATFLGLGFGFNQGGTLQMGYDRGVYFPNSELSSPKLDTLPMNAKLHYRLTYFEIPFGLKMKGGSNEDSRLKYYAEIPIVTLGFLTRSLGDIRGTQSQNSEDEAIRDDVNGLSLAIGAGVGVEYELASSATLVAGLHYQHQLTDMTADDGSVFDVRRSAWKGEKARSSVRMLAFRVGIFF